MCTTNDPELVYLSSLLKKEYLVDMLLRGIIIIIIIFSE